MALHIYEHYHFLLLVYIFYQFFQVEYLGLIVLLAILPLPVEVAAVGREAIVPPHHSVRINHRNHLEQVVASQGFPELVVAN